MTWQISYQSANKQLRHTRKMESNAYTSVDLVRTFLARIDEVNPSTHAVTEINPNALKIAQALDEERKVSGPRRLVNNSTVLGSQLTFLSVIHGIPILVKNMFAVDGLNTSAGSYMLLGANPGKRLQLSEGFGRLVPLF